MGIVSDHLQLALLVQAPDEIVSCVREAHDPIRDLSDEQPRCTVLATKKEPQRVLGQICRPKDPTTALKRLWIDAVDKMERVSLDRQGWQPHTSRTRLPSRMLANYFLRSNACAARTCSPGSCAS